jgi:hypothetical protein
LARATLQHASRLPAGFFRVETSRFSYRATRRFLPGSRRQGTYDEGFYTFLIGLTMSILGNIFRKIFPSAEAATPTAPAPAGTPGATSAPAMPMVDVEAVLNDMAKSNPEKLNWKTSIVDLMKLLGLDSSLSERKELAKELGYTGDTSDSAAMNIWLHRQVMNKVAANGGKVPAELKD